MKKPIKESPVPPCYDWHGVADWIKYKTNRDVRDWAGKFTSWPYDPSLPYQDFWHLFCDDVHNGCYYSLSLNLDDWNEPWAKEIVQVIRDEFPECAEDYEMPLWIAW